jgi:hypothetical protein
MNSSLKSAVNIKMKNAYHGLAPGLVPGTHDKDQYIDHKYLDRKYDMKGNLVQTSLNSSGRGRATRARGGKCQTGRVPARVTAANPLFSRAVPPPRAPCYSAGTAHRYLSCVHPH